MLTKKNEITALNLVLSDNQSMYIQKWDELESKMIKERFHWAALMENGEWNQYMSFTVLQIEQVLWNKISKATEDIGSLLQKTYQILLENQVLMDKLNIPKELREIVLLKSLLFSYFSRMDLILSGGELKICEINADTPVGFVEPSIGNRIICNEYGLVSPNRLEENIERTWRMLIQDFCIPKDETIYFSAYEWHTEDTSTVEFNRKHCLHEHTEFVDIERIIVNSEGLFTLNGNRIRFLYRLYPLEFLLEEGERGRLIIDHIKNGRVQLINPTSAFLIQTKELMALIWELFENDSELYNSEEKEIIKKHFIPTYWDNQKFVEKGLPYVSKPILGREGGGISIIDGENVEEDVTEYYYKQDKIFQQYIDMPKVTIETWDGPYEGRLLIGSHLIGGKSSGLFMRVGERITGNLSMFCGVAVK